MEDNFYKISLRVVDKDTLDPINNVTITDSNKNTSVTNKNGDFTIQGNYNPDEFTLFFKVEGYSSKDVNLLTKDGKIKTNLSVIQLDNIQKSIDKEKLNSLKFSTSQKENIIKQKKTDFVSSLSNKISSKIKKTILPILITQLAAFGVTNISELIKKATDPTTGNVNPDKLNGLINNSKTCPSSPEEMKKIIKKLNQLSPQLNILYNSTTQLTNYLEIPSNLINTLNTTLPLIKTSFGVLSSIPSSATTPIPVGPILSIKDTIEDLETLISVSNSQIQGGQFQVNMVLEDFKKTLDYVNILDGLIKQCSEGLGIDLEEFQRGLNQSIEELSSNQQYSNTTPSEVNGFTLDIETEDTLDKLKRKRAVGKNSNGVIMIKGPFSFSSSEDILKQELIFIIKRDNLKAN